MRNVLAVASQIIAVGWQTRLLAKTTLARFSHSSQERDTSWRSAIDVILIWRHWGAIWRVSREAATWAILRYIRILQPRSSAQLQPRETSSNQRQIKTRIRTPLGGARVQSIFFLRQSEFICRSAILDLSGEQAFSRYFWTPRSAVRPFLAHAHDGALGVATPTSLPSTAVAAAAPSTHTTADTPTPSHYGSRTLTSGKRSGAGSACLPLFEAQLSWQRGLWSFGTGIWCLVSRSLYLVSGI